MAVLTVEAISRVVHEVNRAYCMAIGDSSQKRWDGAPDWQKKSCRDGVLLHTRNPNMSAEESHEKWLSEKKESGWKWGPVKNEDKKEHPCCVPYQELPIEQKVKDFLFATIVSELVRLR